MEAKAVVDDFVDGELAALVMMLLRVRSSGQDEFRDFGEQLDECGKIGSGVGFTRAYTAIVNLYRDKPYLFDTAHHAIRSVLTEMEKAKDWGGCGYVTQEQIRNLCK
jgi:hypothetical protein